VSIYEHCNRWARRRPVAAIIIALAMAALAVGIVVLVIASA